MDRATRAVYRHLLRHAKRIDNLATPTLGQKTNLQFGVRTGGGFQSHLVRVACQEFLEEYAQASPGLAEAVDWWPTVAVDSVFSEPAGLERGNPGPGEVLDVFALEKGAQQSSAAVALQPDGATSIKWATRPLSAVMRLAWRLPIGEDGFGNGSGWNAVGDMTPEAADPRRLDLAFAVLRALTDLRQALEVEAELAALDAASAERLGPAEKLLEGTLVLAKLIDRTADTDAVHRALDVLVQRIEERVMGKESDEEQALTSSGEIPSLLGRQRGASERLPRIQALNSVLFDEYGFKGEFGNVAERSCLTKVLADRRGLPILLCCIYHILARRIGTFQTTQCPSQ